VPAVFLFSGGNVELDVPEHLRQERQHRPADHLGLDLAHLVPHGVAVFGLGGGLQDWTPHGLRQWQQAEDVQPLRGAGIALSAHLDLSDGPVVCELVGVTDTHQQHDLVG